MKSASNGDILQNRLQVLHVHVFLVAPLGTGHMAKPVTDQHQSRVAVRKTAYYPSSAADLPVQPLETIVGADAGPVFTVEIAVGQRFLYAVSYQLIGGFLQLHFLQLVHHSFGPFAGGLLALLSVDRLEYLGH